MLVLKHFVVILFVITFKCSASARQPNNVCKSYEGYFSIDRHEDCSYNPDVYATTFDLFKRYVGNFETYETTTEDGYILTVFRIPRQNPRGIVVLNHAVLTDSIVFMGQSNQSLAFQFWYRGYEVWLPNSRGTVFSERHVSLHSSQEEYWDFSYHEIGYYDYASAIRLVKKVTGRNDLIVLGHSMGTTSAFVYAALRPEESMNSVKLYIHLCPSAVYDHYFSPTKYLANLLPVLMGLLKRTLHIVSEFKYDSLIGRVLHVLVLQPFKIIIPYAVSFLSGWTPDEMDLELIPVFGTQNPRGAALKILWHFSQAVNVGGPIRQFDYGARKNLQLYNSTRPPVYPLAKIKVPTFLISGSSDSLATLKDSQIIYNILPKEAKIYGQHIVSGMNHIDFLVGKSRISKVFTRIFELLDKIT